MRVLLPFVLCLGFTSCASIVSKSDWPVTIQSNPAGAMLKIMDEDGVVVDQGTAPMTLTLDSKEGFFKGEDYSIEATLPGYNPARVEMPSRLNPWYFGNIIFGGLIGMLIVDPATGAMWKLRKDFNVTLSPVTN
ncbi:MAG: hypothetical protein ABL998_22925 [Planctomycetota bacterium]